MIHCFTRTHVSQSTLRVDSSSQDTTEPNLLIWSPGWALRNAVSPSDGVYDLSRELERDAGGSAEPVQTAGFSAAVGSRGDGENGSRVEQDSLQSPGLVHAALTASGGKVTAGAWPI